MACNFGLPVISSNCEGPSDIVNNLNGIIISKMIQKISVML